jgi:predicted lipid-binding transport protein (Tim44 family)
MDALALQARETVYPPSPPAATSEAGAGVSAIQVRDKAFNPSDFLVDVRQVFLRIEQARSELSPELLRPVLSDQAWATERVRMEADAAVGSHHIHAMLDIDQVQLIAASADEVWDAVTARVRARSADHIVGNEGQALGSDNTIVPWHMHITFQRNAGLQSNPLAGLNLNDCGACGAPFDIDDAGYCRACRKHITGGEYDWVVTAIGEPALGAS